MKKITLLLALMLAFLSAPIYAQQAHGICGVGLEDGKIIKERLFENRRNMPNFAHQRGAVSYVPVKIHLVGASTTGAGRLSNAAALDMLCILNEQYLEHDIQFYLKGPFSYFNNTLVMNHNNFDNNPGNVWSLAGTVKANNALNIYVTGSVGGANTLAYYTPGIDCIFIRKGSIYSQSTLAHEVGHFFSLNHPFFGWEDNPWEEATHGLQVSAIGPGGLPNETMSGSNCMNAADGICDTPPDYLFAFSSSQDGCSPFAGGCLDPQGAVVDPLEINTMSYFGNCTSYEFTEDQVTAIHQDLASPGRAYVNPGTTPSLTEINELPTLLGPLDQEVRPYNAVLFEWEAVEGATRYIVEVDRSTSFNIDKHSFVAYTNSAFVGDEFLPNTAVYYWRVRPFSAYNVCTSWSSETGTFSTENTPSSVNNIDGINQWTVRPNPVKAQESLFLDIETTEAFQGTVKVYSLTGKLVTSLQNDFAKGNATLKLPTANLSTGMYLVSIQSESGIMTKRIVIQ